MYENLLTIAIIATAACAVAVALVSLRRFSLAKSVYARADQLIDNFNTRDTQVRQLTEKLNRYFDQPERPANLEARSLAVDDLEQSLVRLRESLVDFRRQHAQEAGALSAALGEGQRDRLAALESRSSERLDALVDAADRALAQVRRAGGS
jgi:Skp family chaperone for outer membrane proteins